MKKNNIALIILIVITNWGFAQDITCSRNTNFGKADLCLPLIENYQECYLDPVIKRIADGTEVPANMVLGYYLNNDTYQQKNDLDGSPYEDYFKVYGTKQIKDYPADTGLIKEMQDLLNNNFVSKNWDEMEKEIDKVGLDVEIGVPTLVKSYNLNKDSFTFIMITKYQINETESYTMAMTINGMIINKRMIWMAYYLNYKGEETLKKLQENSNAIVDKLMSANN